MMKGRDRFLQLAETLKTESDYEFELAEKLVERVHARDLLVKNLLDALEEISDDRCDEVCLEIFGTTDPDKSMN